MPSPNRNGFLKRLWNLFSPEQKKQDETALQGSQFPSVYGNSRNLRLNLELDIIPVRYVNNDREFTLNLIEMYNFCEELRHSLFFLSRDTFLTSDGTESSWTVASEYEVAGEIVKVHPDVLLIAHELEKRRFGKQLVIGGERLGRAVRESLLFGDAFMELGIEKDGLGDYGIVRSQYLPSLSMFACEDEHEAQIYYAQRKSIQPSPDDVIIPAVKCLQFTHMERGLYGTTIANVEGWKRYKKTASNLLTGSEAQALSPWLHVMPEGADQTYVEGYAYSIENMRQSGIITDLYLKNGADLRKPEFDSNVLKPLIEHSTLERMGLVVPGIPNYMFAWLAKDGGQKDLSTTPSLAYARQIAHIRSMLSAQIRWAISLEIVLKKGFDWYLEHGTKFDVSWSPFAADPNSAMMMTQDELKDENVSPDNKEDSPKSEESFRVLMNGFRN